MMTRLQNMLAATVLIIGISGCAIVDPADMTTFETLVQKLPKADQASLLDGARKHMDEQVLKKRDPRTRAVYSECRERATIDEPWSPWKANITGEVTAGELLTCLETGHSYAHCIAVAAKAAALDMLEGLNNEADKKAIRDEVLQCVVAIEDEFNVSEVEKEETDWSDVFDWLLRSPVPPTGLNPSIWRALAPMLVGITPWGGDAAAGNYDGVPGSTSGGDT